MSIGQCIAFEITPHYYNDWSVVSSVYYLQGAKITYEKEANLVIDYYSLSRNLKQVIFYLRISIRECALSGQLNFLISLGGFAIDHVLIFHLIVFFAQPFKHHVRIR